MVYKFFDNKKGWGVHVNEKLAAELRQPIIKKFKRTRAHWRFNGNLRAIDLDEPGIIVF